MTTSQAVTPTQAARSWGIPPGTVRSWISRARLSPVSRRGRYNVYDVAQLADLKAEMVRRRDSNDF